MKVLILLVVLIAAFTSNCRDISDGHTKPAIDITEPDSDVYQQQKKDVKGSIGIELRGKKDKKNLNKLVDKLESLGYKLTLDNLKLNNELQSLKHSMTSNHAAILSKMNSASASNSQLKTDMTSMKQSLTSNHAAILSKLNSISVKLGTTTTVTPTTTSTTTTPTTTTTTTTTTPTTTTTTTTPTTTPTTTTTTPTTTTTTTPTTTSTTTTTTTPPTTTTTTTPTTTTIPSGTLIRPTKTTPYMNWSDSVKYCQDMGAEPFIPRTNDDFQVYNNTSIYLSSYIWIPASDIQQENRLMWTNGEDAPSSDPGLVWDSGRYMYYNSADRDCVLYYTGFSGAHMGPCHYQEYPMICKKN